MKEVIIQNKNKKQHTGKNITHFYFKQMLPNLWHKIFNILIDHTVYVYVGDQYITKNLSDILSPIPEVWITASVIAGNMRPCNNQPTHWTLSPQLWKEHLDLHFFFYSSPYYNYLFRIIRNWSVLLLLTGSLSISCTFSNTNYLPRYRKL